MSTVQHSGSTCSDAEGADRSNLDQKLRKEMRDNEQSPGSRIVQLYSGPGTAPSLHLRLSLLPHQGVATMMPKDVWESLRGFWETSMEIGSASLAQTIHALTGSKGTGKILCHDLALDSTVNSDRPPGFDDNFDRATGKWCVPRKDDWNREGSMRSDPQHPLARNRESIDFSPRPDVSIHLERDFSGKSPRDMYDIKLPLTIHSLETKDEKPEGRKTGAGEEQDISADAQSVKSDLAPTDTGALNPVWTASLGPIKEGGDFRLQLTLSGLRPTKRSLRTYGYSEHFVPVQVDETFTRPIRKLPFKIAEETDKRGDQWGSETYTLADGLGMITKHTPGDKAGTAKWEQHTGVLVETEIHGKPV